MPDEVDHLSGIRIIGPEVSYADGAEARIAAILEEAGDRSTGSDELAAHVTDWPSRYHLSRQRANLLRPLRFRPGQRVLDVGAGTGALTRYVAEQGSEVVALEGSLARARAAADRCQGLDGVEVLCGSVADLADPAGFDLVLCVGVLEYWGAQADEMLAHVRTLLRPGGSLVLAIENQLGLKYLLGYGEDHHHRPWVGVEGYLGAAGSDPRTFSRRSLGAMLAQAGFGAQRWLFPFPDYKLPGVVLDERAYADIDATDFVDQLVRWPCSPLASAPSRLCDDRAAHRVFLEAGLGPEVANSFLVLAGREAAATEVADPGVRAWFFGQDRMRTWLGYKTFPQRSEVAQVASGPIEESDRHTRRGWLGQQRSPVQAHVSGRTVEQEALDACGLGVEALAGVLGQWRDHLREVSRRHERTGGDALPSPAVEPAHPFAPTGHTGTGGALPSDHLDVDLANFVVGPAGPAYVDDEWRADGDVDADLVCLRALWGFAAALVSHGVRHPWPPSSTVDELAEAMGALCGTPAGPAPRARLREAQAQLYAKVAGVDLAAARDHHDDMGALSQVTPGVVRHLPFTTLGHTLVRSDAHLAGICARLEESMVVADAVRRSLAEQVELADRLGRDGHAAVEALAATQAELARVQAELEAADRRWQRLTGRAPLRAYRFIRRVLG